MIVRNFEKATFTKSEIMKYLGIGERRLQRLLTNPYFPRKKPIIEKWSRVEIDNWLNNLNNINKENKEQDWKDFIGD